MAVNLAEPVELVTPGELGDELASFVRAMPAMRASNVSPNTILAYGGALRQFGTWLMARGYPTSIRDVGEWIGSLLERGKPATAHNRWRGLQPFFNWYGEVVDDFSSPMRKLKPPRLPKLMPRILTFDEIRAVLGTCQGASFEDRRDNALIRVLFDTGARRHDIAALRYSPSDPDDRDVDLRRRIARSPTRASRRPSVTAACALASRTFTRTTSVHAATHHELAGGMNEADVMSKRGWDSPAILRRHASTTANERAIAASRKLARGDKL